MIWSISLSMLNKRYADQVEADIHSHEHRPVCNRT